MAFRAPPPSGLPASLLYPLRGAGRLHLLVLAAFLLTVRAIEWSLGAFAPGLPTAGALLLGLCGASYAARMALRDVEAAAEGPGEAPPLPDPREVEELLGALLGLSALGFFVMFPFLLVGILDLVPGPLDPALVALGAIYFPAGILGLGVTRDVAGCFPGPAVAVIGASRRRYVPAAALAVAAAMAIEFTHGGAGSRLPLVARAGMDLATAWFLLAALHRVGELHRLVPDVAKALPFPTPETP